MGSGFIPEVLDREIYDRIITVKDEDALETTRRLARLEGLLCGPESGAVTWAAVQVARELGPASRVLGIAPDTGERYLSTDVFALSPPGIVYLSLSHLGMWVQAILFSWYYRPSRGASLAALVGCCSKTTLTTGC